MYKGFVLIGAEESISVVGGTEMEDAARALGRLIGKLVGTIQKLLEKHNESQVALS